MILREMAEALKRISDRQEDIYSALAPIMKVAVEQRVAMSFDKTVVNHLLNLTQQEMLCLEEEAKCKLVDGNTAYLLKKNVLTDDVSDAYFARREVPKVAQEELDLKLAEHERKVLNKVEQESIKCIGRVHKEASDMMDRKTREANRLLGTVGSQVRKASEYVQSLKDNFIDDIRTQVSDEVRKVNTEVDQRALEAKKKTDIILKSIKSQLGSIDESHNELRTKISLIDNISDTIDSRMDAAIRKATKEVENVTKHVQSRLATELEKSSNNIDKLLSDLAKAGESINVRYEEAIGPEVKDLKAKFAEKVERLNVAKKSLEDLEASIGSTIIATEKVVAQVGNVIPKQNKKVFIHGKRNH